MTLCIFIFYLNKDVIGIVDTCSNIIPFTNRISNRDSYRREITLIDKDTNISITLWDEQVKCITINANKDFLFFFFCFFRLKILMKN